MSSDGIDEAIEGQLRIWLTTATQIAERKARQREVELRQAETRSAREARELEARFEAERRIVHVELANVHRDSWWERATEDQIRHAWEVARAWSGEDPEAARAEERMIDTFQARYGITREQLQPSVVQGTGIRRIENEPRFAVWEFEKEADVTRWVSKEDALRIIEETSADAEMSVDRGGLADIKKWVGTDEDVDRAIAAKFSQIMTDKQLAAVKRVQSEDERVEARLLLEQADYDDARAEEARDVAEHAPGIDEDERLRQIVEAEQKHQDAAQTEHDGHQVWDSAERKQAIAEELHAKGIDAEVVATRMRADIAQGKPATEAVKGTVGRRPPAARKIRTYTKKGPELSR
jgi:hypothetical protein